MDGCLEIMVKDIKKLNSTSNFTLFKTFKALK